MIVPKSFAQTPPFRRVRIIEDPLLRGLVGWWKLDNRLGPGGTALDSSRFKNNGTGQGGITIGAATDRRGVANRATTFVSASSQYILVGVNSVFSPGSSDNYSASVWFNTSSIAATFRTFIEKRTTGNATPLEFTISNDQKFEAGTYDGATSKFVRGSQLVNNGLWHFGVMTHKSDGTITAYLDGVSIGTASDNGLSTSNSQGINIGADSSIARYFPGSLMDARIYNRVLTSGEIQQIYLS